MKAYIVKKYVLVHDWAPHPVRGICENYPVCTLFAAVHHHTELLYIWDNSHHIHLHRYCKTIFVYG